jgi:hypothetical protein
MFSQRDAASSPVFPIVVSPLHIPFIPKHYYSLKCHARFRSLKPSPIPFNQPRLMLVSCLSHTAINWSELLSGSSVYTQLPRRADGDGICPLRSGCSKRSVRQLLCAEPRRLPGLCLLARHCTQSSPSMEPNTPCATSFLGRRPGAFQFPYLHLLGRQVYTHGLDQENVEDAHHSTRRNLKAWPYLHD